MKFYCLNEQGYKCRIMDTDMLNHLSSINYNDIKIGDIIPQGGNDPDPYIKGYRMVNCDYMELDDYGSINPSITVDILWSEHLY